MSYKDEYHPKVRSDLKKLDKAVVREIHDMALLQKGQKASV